MSDGKHEEEAKFLIDALAKKGVNGPCPRCGNNAFSIVTLVYSYLAKESDVEKLRTEVEKVRTDVVKASLTQIRWLIGVVAVPTILGLINLFIQYAK